MELADKIRQILSLMGFSGAEVSSDGEHRRISIIIDDELVRSNVASITW